MKYKKNLVLFSLIAMNLVDQPAPEVTIEQGTLTGKISMDGTYFEYIGIPYGSFNSSTRFQAPLPPPSWEGIYKATEEIYSCPQNTKFGVLGREDCLRVNVYVPVFTQKPLPVMVYIHGGAFVFGSGGKFFYGPDFLLRHDVIVVTLNYRLGALGFICLGIKEAPGNAGLKDQIAALRWVQKNIAAFGGDPDNVTLFGESAGGTSTAILLASKAAKGLFHRAIIQSGSSSCSWSVNRKPVWIASLLTKELGYDTEDPHEIYKILSNLSYEDLIKLKPIKPLGLYLDTLLLQLPCVEKVLPEIEPVLTDIPYEALKKSTNNIPVIYGSNSNEGLFLLSGEYTESIEERNIRYLFASDLTFENNTIAAREAKKVKEFYFGDERISIKNVMNLSDIYTHMYFEIPAILETEVLVSSNVTVYNYYFNYHGKRNVVKHRTGYKKEKGSSHGDDLFYLFDARMWPFRISKKDQEMINWMTTMWTNFAKYGDPTPPSSTNLPVKWIPSKTDELNFLYIEKPLKMGPIPNPKAYRLWKDIYSKYRQTNVSFYL